MITAGPFLDDAELGVTGLVIGLVAGLWVVAIVTSTVVWGTVRATTWFLRPRTRSGEEQAAADDAEASGSALRETIATGLIVGVGLCVGLLAAHRWWTMLT